MKFNILLGTAVCYFGLVCQCTAFEETIEAEDLTDLLGADPSPIDSNDPWYIDYKNAKNSHIGWISNIPKTGLYEVGLFYSSNDANGRPLDLFVTYLHKSPCCNELDDRVHQFQIPQIPDNTAWDKWETEWSAPIELTKGDVHFYLNAVKEKGGPNIDKIYIRSVFEPNTCDITNGEDWCLMRDGPVETTFDDESTPEMTIPYLVSDHLDLDHITTEIYSGDCETVSAAVFDKEFLPNSPDGFKKMKLYIDLDHETLLDSDLWKNGNADNTEGDIR